jgi:hypothetical protein
MHLLIYTYIVSEDIERPFRLRSSGRCFETSNYTLRQVKIILSFVPNHHVIITYKGDHITQKAFIISILSVNNSLNSLAVVGWGKNSWHKLNRILCEIGSSRIPMKNEDPCPFRRIQAVYLLYYIKTQWFIYRLPTLVMEVKFWTIRCAWKGMRIDI